MWCVPEVDAEYIERMEDVLEVLERPLDAAEPVVALDERPVVLHDDVRPPVSMRPGRAKRRDYEYVRRGTANVFCIVEPKAGRHYSHATANRKAPAFAEAMRRIARAYPKARTIHVILDNLNTHGEGSLIKTFGPKRGAALWKRFTIHYTPKHASWLDPAEIEASAFSRECLGRDRISNLDELIRRTKAWNDRRHRERRVINWTFTRAEARKRFGYRRRVITSASRH
jgi:hypothetical protein